MQLNFNRIRSICKVLGASLAVFAILLVLSGHSLYGFMAIIIAIALYIGIDILYATLIMKILGSKYKGLTEWDGKSWCEK